MKYKIGEVFELKVDNIHVILQVTENIDRPNTLVPGKILKDLNGEWQIDRISVSYSHREYLTKSKAGNILFGTIDDN